MHNSAEIVWERCLSFIRDNVGEQNFKTWFLPIKALSLKNNTLTIQVPSKFFFEWIEENYLDLLKSVLKRELGPNAKLVYSILMEKKSKSNGKQTTLDIPSSNKTPIKSQEVSPPLRYENSLKNPFVIPGIQKLKIESNLNPDYSLDQFLEGASNRLARSAGKAISKRPGQTAFNPMFIHSEVGLGKTHLANAIGLEIKRLHPEKTVLYVSADKFMQQFQQSQRNNNRNDFLYFYQLIDVLIVDDIHFLSGKKGTQEVFFNIFNDLHQKGKQIILTSDKPCSEIHDLEERLISRFKWGLTAEILPPDYELRKAILLKKMERDGIQMPIEVVEYIAKFIRKNVREMVGALNSIIAEATFNKKEITLDLAVEVLKQFLTKPPKDLNIDTIQRIVADHFQIPLEVMHSKTRKREIVQVRQLAMYFAKEYTNSSLEKIGAKIGNRDHATVLHAHKTVLNLKETNPIFRNEFEKLQRKIAPHANN